VRHSPADAMYRLFLSLRFLRHHWLMTLIGSFFVGASLVILVVVMAVMDGFQAKLKETIAGASADLMLSPGWNCDPVRLAAAVEELVPGVEAAAPYYETITLTRKAGKVDPMREKMHYAAVFGIDPAREPRVNRFAEYLSVIQDRGGVRRQAVRDPANPFEVLDPLDRASGTVGVVIGVGLAKELNVLPKEKIRIAIAETKGDEANGGPKEVSLKYLQVVVVGLYQSGNSDLDKSCVFMDQRDFRGFFGEEMARASVRCKLADPDRFDSEAAAAAIRPVLDKLAERSVIPAGAEVPKSQRRMVPEFWRDRNRALAQAIESEKSMILVIAFLIVVAGTSSIFAAQWLLVSDKIREIGILRALGADFNGVVSIFVLNGFLMGLLGALGGTFGGLLVVRYIDAVHEGIEWVVGKKVFDPTIYLFDKIPTRVDSAEVARYAGAALVCTLIAAAIPAIRAGLMKPAEALHRD
jgi:lipoprotein-releasing system permease protein